MTSGKPLKCEGPGGRRGLKRAKPLPACEGSIDVPCAALYMIALLLMITGFVFATWAVLSLGRSISIVPQARQLVTTGPYSFVRHPLYLGEMAATAGIALQYSAPWALLLFALQCTFQFWRIKNEERLLSGAFPAYAVYTMRSARLVPGIY